MRYYHNRPSPKRYDHKIFRFIPALATISIGLFLYTIPRNTFACHVKSIHLPFLNATLTQYGIHTAFNVQCETIQWHGIWVAFSTFSYTWFLIHKFDKWTTMVTLPVLMMLCRICLLGSNSSHNRCRRYHSICLPLTVGRSESSVWFCVFKKDFFQRRQYMFISSW